MSDSYNWIDVGSGNLGKVFVEVLSCDHLPNMDTGGTFGNKTDSFVSVVYEDCFARTDVINDCLSPRWLPWSQRAFIFNMMHTSSQLFLGVFDYDSNAFSDHDFIGRVSVDLSNFQPDTVYVLNYKLYPVSFRLVCCMVLMIIDTGPNAYCSHDRLQNTTVIDLNKNLNKIHQNTAQSQSV